MIFISAEFRRSGVFSASLVNPFDGDPMTKLIASALLSFGIAAAAMAADTPSSTGSPAASAPAASSSSAPAKSTKKHSGKKGKKSTPAPKQ
ncbi:MAG: hypothetical protein ABSG30_07555 [Steroidobacteraceae bacterium]|jgi:hypothetical protein